MPDNLRSTHSDIKRLHQEMDAITKRANPSYHGLLEQMKHAIEPIRRQDSLMENLLGRSGIESQLQEMVRANQHWQELIGKTTATDQLAEGIATAHRSWTDALKPIELDLVQLSRLQASTKLALCDASLRLTATERLFATIDLEAIMGHFKIEMPVISAIESSIAHAAASYGGLATSLQDALEITRLPAFVLPGATRELFTGGFALEALYPAEDRNLEEMESESQLVADAEEETCGCIDLLKQIDPMLARPYIGAKAALSSGNSDRARHILISLRELWTHLLRRLAPDDQVIGWIPSVEKQNGLLHEGRPTRRARVLYVCRNLNSDPLKDFLVNDTTALIKLIDLFNRVHELESDLSDEQLRAIILKTDSWIMYILQISGEK
jgi:hypothetical protein